jgi:hypothetical protein
MIDFPSVQRGEADTEDIGDFKVRHPAFAALAGDYNHPWAIDRFTTAASVTEAAPVAERRTSFSPLRQCMTRLVHGGTLARCRAVCR